MNEKIPSEQDLIREAGMGSPPPIPAPRVTHASALMLAGPVEVLLPGSRTKLIIRRDCVLRSVQAHRIIQRTVDGRRRVELHDAVQLVVALSPRLEQEIPDLRAHNRKLRRQVGAARRAQRRAQRLSARRLIAIQRKRAGARQRVVNKGNNCFDSSRYKG